MRRVLFSDGLISTKSNLPVIEARRLRAVLLVVFLLDIVLFIGHAVTTLLVMCVCALQLNRKREAESK